MSVKPPRLGDGTLPSELSPDLRLVLGCIDGKTTVAELAETIGCDKAEIERRLEILAKHKVIDWEGASSAKPASSIPAGRVVSMKPPDPSFAFEQGPKFDQAALHEEVDLDLERRKQILLKHAQLEEMSHYEILEVARTASKDEIRKAYFRLSKVFHPDTMFGKRLGSYKARMEGVFQQLTEAYDCLRKQEQRESYDAYLTALEQTRAIDRSMAEAEATATAFETDDTAPGEPAPPPSTAASAPSRSEAEVQDMQRARREMMARRLASATGRSLGKPTPTPKPEAPPPPPAPLDKSDRLRQLAGSLREVARVTGGVDKVQQYIDQARESEQRDDLLGATNALRLALALSPQRAGLDAEYKRVRFDLARSLADTYTRQARYEERSKRWAQAALSWTKVCEGRPADGEAFLRAAEALMEAEADTARVRPYAQKAAELLPNNARSHKVLGRVYAAAGMTQSARRELKAAQKLDPDDPVVKTLLRELK